MVKLLTRSLGYMGWVGPEFHVNSGSGRVGSLYSWVRLGQVHVHATMFRAQKIEKKTIHLQRLFIWCRLLSTHPKPVTGYCSWVEKAITTSLSAVLGYRPRRGAQVLVQIRRRRHGPWVYRRQDAAILRRFFEKRRREILPPVAALRRRSAAVLSDHFEQFVERRPVVLDYHALIGCRTIRVGVNFRLHLDSGIHSHVLLTDWQTAMGIQSINQSINQSEKD